MSGEDREERKPQFAYLDLLASTLTEHEKTLDGIIERLEEITHNLTEIVRRTTAKRPIELELKTAKTTPEDSETLVYIKMNIKRPVEEVAKILESLKE